jgi:hypothetical protein
MRVHRLSSEGPEDLPAREMIASEIVEDLQAALDQIAAIAASPGRNGSDRQLG